MCFKLIQFVVSLFNGNLHEILNGKAIFAEEKEEYSVTCNYRDKGVIHFPRVLVRK